MAQGAASFPAPDVATIERICAIDDLTLRNLQITDCYHRLSTAVSARTGACANWCTYAVWASRQAGQTIRGEDLIHRLRLDEVRGLWRMLMRRGILTTWPFNAFGRASSAVSRGNLKVFAEIAPGFARYLAGDPEPASPDAPLLREAFRHYRQAESESDWAARMELIATANLQIGLHEQTRLQPEILAALDAPAKTIFVLSGRTSRLLRRAITEALMVLTVPPDRRIELGRDFDQPCVEPLRQPRLPALRELMARYRRADCGADDWSVLEQRMCYILELFTGLHLSPELLEAPFTSAQTAEIRAGRIPAGAL